MAFRSSAWQFLPHSLDKGPLCSMLCKSEALPTLKELDRSLPGSVPLSELMAVSRKASMLAMGLRMLGSSISCSLAPMLRHTISPTSAEKLDDGLLINTILAWHAQEQGRS